LRDTCAIFVLVTYLMKEHNRMSCDRYTPVYKDGKRMKDKDKVLKNYFIVYWKISMSC